MSGARVGELELARLRRRLTPRDLQILAQVGQLRLMSARQIEAVHFPAELHASQAAAAKASRRVLERLSSDRLLARLERRIGGIYAGSAGYVYTLGPLGHRLLQLEQPRPRLYEPSQLFVEHTLAISQLAVNLTVASRTDLLELLQVQGEPDCWRRVPGLARVTLRPDLFVSLGVGEFELRWFVEIDRGSVHLPTLLKKCQLYETYYGSGNEQAGHGVFPRVLWISRSDTRATGLHRAIAASKRLTDRVFTTATEKDALNILTGGVE
jgi:protein involved in plasmid replication-relaxation